MKAIFWDYDGTLVDTRKKNYRVTKNIIASATGNDPSKYPVLKSFSNYCQSIQYMTNWRDLYEKDLGLSRGETDRVGSMWAEFQLKDNTTSYLYPGVKDVLDKYKHLPHAIISQNSSENIWSVLKRESVNNYFRKVIGYEEVDIRSQKPDPAGVIYCIENIENLENGTIAYIGDHESDVQLVLNTNRFLSKNGSALKMISIAALYIVDTDISGWTSQPDIVARQIEDLAEILQRPDLV